MVQISDLSLFKVAIYDAFVNNGHFESSRPIWKNPWVIGGAAAITGVFLTPLAFTTITGALGLGSGGVAATGAVGAAGGAIGGGFGKFFADRTLSHSEEKSLGEFMKIELVNSVDGNNQEKDNAASKVIFRLHRPILRDEKIVETFLQVLIVVSPLTRSKNFDFMVDSQDVGAESLQGCLHLLQKLVQTYNGSRVSVLSENKEMEGVRGYSLDLTEYEPSPDFIPIIEAWKKAMVS